MEHYLIQEKRLVNCFLNSFINLRQLGIHFVAASGRQYSSIAQKLHPIMNEITIVGENGGVIKRQQKTLLLQTFDTNKVIKLIPALRNINNTSIILCWGKLSFY
jgi:hydroxymethylpyrimidine pyrophosphatase-like HAD family hydrolase